MIFERGLDDLTCRPDSILTVGIFDGVHLGHRMIIADLVERAKDTGGLSTLITFDPHPREVLLQQPLPKLTTIEERAAILSSLGLARMVVLPFTEKFSTLEAEDFVLELLVKRTGLQTIIVGHDHRFGKGRKGDVDLLASLGRQHNFDVEVIRPYKIHDLVISSRKVRSILQEAGDVSLAARLMARPHCLTGRVVRGDGRGRELGYPTANLILREPQKVVPSHGIYVVNVEVSGAWLGGMMSIGTRPAIKDSRGVHLEVHLLDFDRPIYGEEITVHFLERIRAERNFASMEGLQAAMQQDEVISREVLELSEWHRVTLG